MNNGERLVGQTHATGFQIGVRRTLPVALEMAWQLLTSQSGVCIWLGEIGTELAKGTTYRLPDGTTGEVTVFSPHSHLRMTWQPVAWERPSIIQARIRPGSTGTTISFHQEWLPGPHEREERRAWFVAAFEELQKLV